MKVIPGSFSADPSAGESFEIDFPNGLNAFEATKVIAYRFALFSDGEVNYFMRTDEDYPYGMVHQDKGGDAGMSLSIKPRVNSDFDSAGVLSWRNYIVRGNNTPPDFMKNFMNYL